MLKNIQIQKNVITCEGLSFFRPKAETLNKLAGFHDETAKFINKLLEGITTANTKVAIDGRRFLPLIKATEYTTLGATNLMFPKEFNADYAKIVEVLKSISVVPDTLYRDLMVPFNQWLAKTLNDPKLMESVNQYVNVDVNRCKIAKERLTAITKGGGQPAVRYPRAIRRNSDWNFVIQGLNELTAQNSNVEIDDVRNKMQEIDKLLQMLIVKMNEPKFEYRPTGKFVDTLVSITYAIAEEIEFYSQYQYLLGTVVTCVRDNVDSLTKQLA